MASRSPVCLKDRYEAGSSKLAEIIETAVRVTNNNDEALRYAKLCSVLLQGVIHGKSTIESIREALASADSETRKRLEKALSTESFVSPFKPSKASAKLAMFLRRFQPFFTCSHAPSLSAKP